MLARLVGKPLFWIAVITTLFAFPLVRSILRPLPKALPQLGELAPFMTPYAAGEKTGQVFDARDLSGRVWLASFLDPKDADCLPIIDAMTKLQRRARNLGDAWRLVTFVPPGADRREVADFAASHHPNPWRWLFLDVPAPVETEFQQALYRIGAAAPLAGLAGGIVHSRHLVGLVDRRGRIRGFYDLRSQEGPDALLADAGLLANLDQ